MTCPICKKKLDETAVKPFCSERCRLIDLGNWLGGNYRVPDPATDQREDKPDSD
jgi:endogenous inhibitor of DNA gyrase (YacG/DUF329 family)